MYSQILSSMVVVYDASSDLGYQAVYLSTDAGMTYRHYKLATDKWVRQIIIIIIIELYMTYLKYNI